MAKQSSRPVGSLRPDSGLYPVGIDNPFNALDLRQSLLIQIPQAGRLASTFAKIMKYKIPLLILAALAIVYWSFRIGVNASEQRFMQSMTEVAQSIGHKVTEEEMLKLMVTMTYLVNEMDIQGLQRGRDTYEARLMLIIYSLLHEEKLEEATKLSGSMMKGYLLREDEDADEELQQKIRDLLKQYPINSSSEPVSGDQ